MLNSRRRIGSVEVCVQNLLEIGLGHNALVAFKHLTVFHDHKSWYAFDLKHLRQARVESGVYFGYENSTLVLLCQFIHNGAHNATRRTSFTPKIKHHWYCGLHHFLLKIAFVNLWRTKFVFFLPKHVAKYCEMNKRDVTEVSFRDSIVGLNLLL